MTEPTLYNKNYTDYTIEVILIFYSCVTNCHNVSSLKPYKLTMSQFL